MSIDVQRAIEFVRNNANELELARLKSTLAEEFDIERVLEGFGQLQNPDGGFPYADRQGWPSCLSNTAQALHTLLEMGLKDSDIAQASIRFLLEMRRDGIFPENEKIAPLGPPFWDMPGDDRTTLWLTADIVDLLLRAGHDKSDLGQGAEFIREHQAPEGNFMGYVHTTWISLSVFGPRGFDLKPLYDDALAYLETLDLMDWDASCLAWCLDCMKNGQVDSESPLWKLILERLAILQELDGSWPTDDGEHLRTRNTNAVLSSLADIIDLS